MKRFNLVIPNKTYADLEELAQKYKTSKSDMIRRHIRLGLQIEHKESLHVFRDENGEFKEVQYD